MNRTLTAFAAAAVVLSSSILVACGGGNDDNGDATPSATSTRAAATATTSAATPTTEATTEPTAGAEPTQPSAADTPVPQATQPPQAQATATPPPPPPPPPPPAAVALSLQALNTRFVPNVLSAPVGATLNITYTNSDAGVSHDVVFFTPSGAEAGRAEIFPGVATRQISFVASVAGVYRFTCSVHPRDMNGVLNVQ